MKLQDRLHKIAEHAVMRGLTTKRHQWSDMAKAAGCTPANMRNAARGEQTKMDEDLLKALAKWAGIRSEFACTGMGAMLEAHRPGDAANIDAAKVRSEVDAAHEAASGAGWSREATILAMLCDRVTDPANRRLAFAEASAILVRYG